MSATVEILVRSQNLKRVVSPNSQDATFATVVPTWQAPTFDASNAYTDGANGAWGVGTLSEVMYPNLWFQPFAYGPPGASFSIQVWGFRHAIDSQLAGQNLWIPAFLAEFQCTTANLTGQSLGSLTDAENLCDTISLTAGTLGGGEIASPATDPLNPRPGLPGWVVMNLRSCRYFRMIFQQIDPVAMNAFWAPHS